MLRKYANFCYYHVGSYVLPYEDYFKGLDPILSKADLEFSLLEYLSMALMTVLIVFSASSIALGAMMTLSRGVTGFFTAIIIAILSSSATLVMFFLVPSIIIRNRASKINDTLPFAVMYLSTLAGTGTSIPDIFKHLSEVEEYDEVAKESEKIVRDIETFGMDLSEALKRAADRTPSEDFEELLWGMNHVLTTGGELREFLKLRAESLMDDYRMRVEEFSDQLSLIIEMYITVVIVGSILFTSMSIVMGAFTELSPNIIVVIQLLTVLFAIPFITGAVIILIRGLAPGGVR